MQCLIPKTRTSCIVWIVNIFLLFFLAMRDFVCYIGFIEEVKGMDFYLILQEIMEEKNINIPTVARKSGLSDGTVRSIIKRKQKNVALEVAFKLSNGLNVSLERLNGLPEKELVSTTTESNPKIQLLVKKAESLNNQGILKLIEYADDLTSSGKYTRIEIQEKAI